MSPLAKVFVVLVLFLSVSFLAASATLFSTRKGFKAEIDQYESAWRKAVANYSEQISERDSTILTLTKDREDLTRSRDALHVVKDAAEAKAAELETQNRKLVADLDALQSTNEMNARTLASMETEKADLVKRNDELREQTKSATDRADAQTLAATRLTLDLQQVSKTLQETQIALTEVSRERDGWVEISERAKKEFGAAWERVLVSDPPPAIDAQVMKVSQDDTNLIVLSVGADDGVKQGHEFTVYRGSKFIGKAKVEGVTANLSAAKILFLDGGPVQTGDKATTRLH